MKVTIIKPQNFPQHIIKPIGSSYIPNSWLFLDTETTLHTVDGVSSHYFKIGWTCLWKRRAPLGKDSYGWCYHITFAGLNRYIENIVTHSPGTIIIGHNIFFDLQAAGFYQHFTERGWKLKFYYDQGLTYILKCRKGKGLLTVVSSTNWFDFSLEKLGQALGYPKQTIDFDRCTPQELKEYCRVDVEILVKALEKYLEFITVHELGKFSLTKASQAFTAYRHRFMSHKILVHTDKKVIDLEREGYIGGRCECFQIGRISGGPFVTLDVNSMYPFIMKRNKYPYKLVGYYENKPIDFYTRLLKQSTLIAHIQVDTPYPVFAVKLKGKTIFPTGKFDCVVCSTGFQFALDKGLILKVHKSAVYLKADLFTGYVDYFHDLRLKYKNEGNEMFLLLCKYMHNLLYGKFGQLKIVSEIDDFDNGGEYTREDVFNMNTGRMVTITHFMNQRLIQYPEGEGDNSNVAIAAHITENARFYLWELMCKVGVENVLYCDTDSIKLRMKHINPLMDLIDSDKLGALKIEDKSETLILEGAKNYRTEHKRKIKGIPRKAKEISPGVFTFESFVRQVSHLRSGQITGAQMKTITRTLKHTYSKGTVLPSGKVIPLRFPLPG